MTHTSSASPRVDFADVVFDSGSFTATLGPGVHAFLGAADSGARRLIELASGQLAPRRGRVWVDGLDVFRNPDARARIASTTGASLPYALSVAELVRGLSELRGADIDAARQWVSRVVGEGVLTTPIDELSHEQSHGVDLALALAHECARVLLLWEPFEPPVDSSWLKSVLLERGERQVVLVGTASPPHPALSGSCFYFSGVGASTERDTPQANSLWISADPIAPLARELLSLPGVLHAEVLEGTPGLLRLGLEQTSEETAQRVCREALRIAVHGGIEVRGIRLVRGAVDEL